MAVADDEDPLVLSDDILPVIHVLCRSDWVVWRPRPFPLKPQRSTRLPVCSQYSCACSRGVSSSAIGSAVGSHRQAAEHAARSFRQKSTPLKSVPTKSR